MNLKFLSIVPFIIPLVGCNATVRQNEMSKTAYFKCGITVLGDEYPAQFTFDDGYFVSGFEEMTYVKTPLIAGDCVEIEYTGDILIAESYPSQYYLKGDLINVKWHLTDYFVITKDEVESQMYSSFYQYIDSIFYLTTKWVILDEEMHYCSLEEYSGETLYLTRDMKEFLEHRCPPNANCAEMVSPIGGLYAYQPSFR